MGSKIPQDSEFGRLLRLRTEIRKFMHFTEQLASQAGVQPAQHQLMLAIRGHQDPRGPTIGEACEYLLLKHHSVVELIDRAEEASLVKRHRDSEDGRVVRVSLTAKGVRVLEKLTRAIIDELEAPTHLLHPLWSR
ncbi:MAG: MarR family winged helix-turn-helix transcriptional regulator [Actinomycetota bacterium]